jgi:hypothetical protein
MGSREKGALSVSVRANTPLTDLVRSHRHFTTWSANSQAVSLRVFVSSSRADYCRLARYPLAIPKETTLTEDLRGFSDLLLVSGRNELIFQNSYLRNKLRTVSHSKRSTSRLVSVVRYL